MNVGDVVEGRYRIRRILGEGGTSYVYLVMDEVRHRDAALKIMREEIKTQGDHDRRFETEARILADLHHVNIVQLYAFGYVENTPYTISEYVAAPTLAKALEKRRFFSFREATGIVLQLLEAIRFTHHLGLIHRDIKPHNLFYAADGSVKLCDFGIATSTQGTAHGIERIDGSISYLAPEVIQGKPASVASDIYAIGVTYFELLTGRLPFEGDSLKAIAAQHVKVPFPSPRRYQENLPEGLERILMTACAKNPRDRYQSAEEFARALRALQGPTKTSTSWWKKLFSKKQVKS